MSSNQWEVVTKSRKQKNMDKKVEAHTEKKRLAAVPIKLEEILPSQQYHNIISGRVSKSPVNANGNVNGQKSKSPKKSSTKINVAAKSESEGSSKKSVPPKLPPKPKSAEAALRQITPQDFSAHLDQLKLTFPGSELLWLKGVASFLNTQLPFDCEPTFAGKSVHYPSNIISPKLKAVLVKFLDDMGTANLSYFYHTLLTSMAMELAKNLPIFGYKLLLQLIAKNWPQICSSNMAKTAMLRNSYQNRSNTCLSILWAVGQCGYESLIDGIKVWQNLMLPNLEMKSYSKYVAEYIEKVLKSTIQPLENLNQNEFFITYNALKANFNGISKEYQDTLKRASELFLIRFIASTTKHANLFLTLFREIEHPLKNSIEIVACISCLDKSVEDCFKVWKMNYKKQLVPTILLLRGIEQQWDAYAAQLRNSSVFHDFLSTAETLNLELETAKRRDPYFDELIETVNTIQDKLAQQKKKQAAEQKKGCSCCKWTFGIILVLGLIGATLYYDTNVTGKGIFARSATGKALQKVGLLPHVETAWYTTMSASARGYKWAEQHVPPYAKPAFKLASDLYKLTRNTLCNIGSNVKAFLVAKWPVAAEFLEQYLPGVPKKLENTSVDAQKLVADLYAKSVNFLNTEFFVGKLSPEYLCKVLNDTTNIAAEYYSLFHKKVDFYAKLK